MTVSMFACQKVPMTLSSGFYTRLRNLRGRLLFYAHHGVFSKQQWKKKERQRERSPEGESTSVHVVSKHPCVTTVEAG